MTHHGPDWATIALVCYLGVLFGGFLLWVVIAAP